MAPQCCPCRWAAVLPLQRKLPCRETAVFLAILVGPPRSVAGFAHWSPAKRSPKEFQWLSWDAW
ncbi:hypothetical protein E2562_026090 [Oryza meyeriana var. granulata]|uniref:Uncharacterized protein n=1 Tax=Oryza meyeriana var. granulata TaxID=110450 RepID=A0A6G1EZ16_9ORYZ|nr:hypothetical protein E2562_026090 [Oryza meyeriana var. granulata]